MCWMTASNRNVASIRMGEEIGRRTDKSTASWIDYGSALVKEGGTMKKKLPPHKSSVAGDKGERRKSRSEGRNRQHEGCFSCRVQEVGTDLRDGEPKKEEEILSG